MNRLAFVSVVAVALSACTSTGPSSGAAPVAAQIQSGLAVGSTIIDQGACLVQALANATGAGYEAAGNTAGALISSAASQAAGSLCLTPTPTAPVSPSVTPTPAAPAPAHAKAA